MATPPAAPSWSEICQALLATGDSIPPVSVRYRALFHIRTMAPSPAEGVALLFDALNIQRDSILLRHELAYVLGQLGDAQAAGKLREIARDVSEDDIVRHEAVEALAALEDIAVIDELMAMAATTTSEALKHTCELAVAGLLRKRAGKDALPPCVCQTQFTSRDPAEGRLDATEKDVPLAIATLVDKTIPLYDRYEGMFTLRNVGGKAAATALAEVLCSDDSSAVLRHEVAFVLGQMEDERAVTALIASLADIQEQGMVRHEAAIALGAVGSQDAICALQSFVRDPDLLVAESCQVALETAAYWKAWEELEARLAVSS